MPVIDGYGMITDVVKMVGRRGGIGRRRRTFQGITVLWGKRRVDVLERVGHGGWAFEKLNGGSFWGSTG
jgi:hypothetical protein